MSNILNKIVKNKTLKVEESKKRYPIEFLEKNKFFSRKTYSLQQALKNDDWGIIAEFKRSSPSEKNINLEAHVLTITDNYAKNGATGLSILTDEVFFSGTHDDILEVRSNIKIPILRKDFIISEYQIYEAKAIGADVILLIAAVLTPNQIARFSQLAQELGLETILEVHNKEEIEKGLYPNKYKINIVGVNNRNLKTFETSLQLSIDLRKYIPEDLICISESGIYTPEDVQFLKNAHYDGFLIGTHFMKSKDPLKTFTLFMENLK